MKEEQIPAQHTAFPVPPEGSLGLLALGWRGLTAWREKRRTHLDSRNSAPAPDDKKA